MPLRQPIITTIAIHPLAPAQPQTGAPCNGCGVCCLAFPCPLGRVLSLRRLGRCSALRWSDTERRYLCGAITEPASTLPWGLKWLAPRLSAVARRWIASGIGCDTTSRFID
ncbi:MAG: hypothetical protein ACKODU_04940 [Limnohabitans sp.]|jgi:hypothetical protein